jgi:hypothetical protein
LEEIFFLNKIANFCISQFETSDWKWFVLGNGAPSLSGRATTLIASGISSVYIKSKTSKSVLVASTVAAIGLHIFLRRYNHQIVRAMGYALVDATIYKLFDPGSEQFFFPPCRKLICNTIQPRNSENLRFSEKFIRDIYLAFSPIISFGICEKVLAKCLISKTFSTVCPGIAQLAVIRAVFIGMRIFIGFGVRGVEVLLAAICRAYF